MRMRRLAAALVTIVLTSRIAAANGRFPAANQLVRRPGSTQNYALRSTFGLLVSNDGAKNWDWVCEQSFNFNGSTDAPTQYSAGGTILVGTFYGAYAAQNSNACQWDLVSTVPPKFVPDVTVRVDRPNTALVLISANDMTGYDTRLFDSQDDGKTFAERYKFDPTLIADGVESGGASNSMRVYVTAYRINGKNNDAVILVSDDDGKTFLEHPVPTDPISERGIYIAGVDPTNADRVYVRTTGSLPDDGGANTTHPYNRLYVSEDGGKTFKVIFTAEGLTQMSEQALLGFALSADGSKIYTGGPVQGLNVASRTDFNFKKTSDLQLECLAMLDGVLWACSRTQFALGTTVDDGANFTPVLELSQIRGPLACPPESSFNKNDAGGCLTVWPPIRDTLKIDAGPMPDAGRDASSGGGCSCDSTSDGDDAGWLGAGMAALLGTGIVLGRLRRTRA
jgi:hypothetical protein